MGKALKYNKQGKNVGVFLTIGIHLLLILFLGVTGLKIIYPPPAEKGILLEIPIDEIKPEEIQQKGVEPKGENPDPKKEVTLVQQSKSQVVDMKNNAGVKSTVGDDGDIEKPEPKREEIDKRALFTSDDNQNNKEGEQTAIKISETLKAGHPQGNTNKGAISGEPSVRLKGRESIGQLPKPDYKINEGGIVVVKIVVNQEGKVTSATPGSSIPGGERTTTSNATLWEAAKKAALKSKFSNSTQIDQIGYIIYKFTLE